MPSRLDEYGQFMHVVAARSGEIIRSGFDASLEVYTKEADQTPVTSVDRAVNSLVADMIEAAYPQDTFVGEETGGQLSDGRNWVCDPLDGTKAFVNGIPLAAFALALVEDGQAVCSIVYDPFMRRGVVAAVGEGAWMNGKRLHVSSQGEIKDADVHISWGKKGALERVRILRNLGAKVIKMDATVYVGMLTAMGKLDADIFTGSSPWDVAAQSLAITEAGGRVSTLAGDELIIADHIDGSIMTNARLHEIIVDVVRRSLADDAE